MTRENRQDATQLLGTLLAVLMMGVSGLAQDNVRGSKEPIVSSIDPSKLIYDILVDGNLDRDDPSNLRFKTLQAAYAVLRLQGPTKSERSSESNQTCICSLPMNRERPASKSLRTTSHSWVSPTIAVPWC